MSSYWFDSDKEEKEYKKMVFKEIRSANRYKNRHVIYSNVIATLALVVSVISLIISAVTLVQ